MRLSAHFYQFHRIEKYYDKRAHIEMAIYLNVKGTTKLMLPLGIHP